MRFGNSDITIGQQILDMQSLFPQFSYQRIKQKPSWIGTLNPSGNCEYTVKIAYSYPSVPKVWVVSPSISDAPHRYKDKSLCLYYPKDRSWSAGKQIARTIVPWTAEWLIFYEIWLITGKWYGPESPHRGRK